MYLLTVAIYLPSVVRSGGGWLAMRRWLLAGQSKRGRPSVATLLAVSLVYVGTSSLTKAALSFIDVPTQTILKSAKLIPVRRQAGSGLGLALRVKGLTQVNLRHTLSTRPVQLGLTLRCPIR